MSSPFFQMKRFTVWHDRCAMRVGTDGVLLGAWTDIPLSGRCLDIGTGSGLIALMLAQRGALLTVDGIEVDAAAAEQAAENFRRSEFAERLRVLKGDVLEMDQSERYDLIVSNPPFFAEDTLAPDQRRSQARSNVALPLDRLMRKVEMLLKPAGTFSLILPYDRTREAIGLAAESGLFLLRRCDVQSSMRKAPVRSLLAFGRTIVSAPTMRLLLRDEHGERTEAYEELTRDFYL